MIAGRMDSGRSVHVVVLSLAIDYPELRVRHERIDAHAREAPLWRAAPLDQTITFECSRTAGR